MMLQYYGWKEIEQGNFYGASKIADKLDQYGIQFNQPHIIAMKYLTRARLNLKQRRFQTAIDEVDQGIRVAHLTDISQMLSSLLSIKAHVLLLMEKFPEAAQVLNQAKEFNAKTEIIPVHLGDFFKARLHCLWPAYRFQGIVVGMRNHNPSGK